MVTQSQTIDAIVSRISVFLDHTNLDDEENINSPCIWPGLDYYSLTLSVLKDTRQIFTYFWHSGNAKSILDLLP